MTGRLRKAVEQIRSPHYRELRGPGGYLAAQWLTENGVEYGWGYYGGAFPGQENVLLYRTVDGEVVVA